jgi:hypothetical protein
VRPPARDWKGAVSFGLVYIPVHLHTAVRDSTLDLDLLDKRDFAPIGYQRYNKHTGKVVDWGDIVKGYEYRKGQYVALTDEDFRQATSRRRRRSTSSRSSSAPTSRPSISRCLITSSLLREARRPMSFSARPCGAAQRWPSAAS